MHSHHPPMLIEPCGMDISLLAARTGIEAINVVADGHLNAGVAMSA